MDLADVQTAWLSAPSLLAERLATSREHVVLLGPTSLHLVRLAVRAGETVMIGSSPHLLRRDCDVGGYQGLSSAMGSE